MQMSANAASAATSAGLVGAAPAVWTTAAVGTDPTKCVAAVVGLGAAPSASETIAACRYRRASWMSPRPRSMRSRFGRVSALVLRIRPFLTMS